MGFLLNQNSNSSVLWQNCKFQKKGCQHDPVHKQPSSKQREHENKACYRSCTSSCTSISFPPYVNPNEFPCEGMCFHKQQRSLNFRGDQQCHLQSVSVCPLIHNTSYLGQLSNTHTLPLGASLLLLLNNFATLPLRPVFLINKQNEF